MKRKRLLFTVLLFLSSCESFIHRNTKYKYLSIAKNYLSKHNIIDVNENHLFHPNDGYLDDSGTLSVAVNSTDEYNNHQSRKSSESVVSKSIRLSFIGIFVALAIHSSDHNKHSMNALAEVASSSSMMTQFFNPSSTSSNSKQQTTSSSKPNAITVTPPDVINILKDRMVQLRSGVTGEKVGQLRVGESLVAKLRGIDQELDTLQTDIFKDSVDWDVVSIYPKIFRAFSPLFTAYTDRAFPTDSAVDNALRYALRYEVGSFYTGVKDLEASISKQNQKQTQRAFAKMSLSYDRYLKAGDLFADYDPDIVENTDREQEITTSSKRSLSTDSNRYEVDEEIDKQSKSLNYVAPSIDAPALQDQIVLLKGPDKARQGTVLWIGKGQNVETANVVVKFSKGQSGHSEVKLYPYSIVAKVEPPDEQFEDNLISAYLASGLSSGIMYPIDTFKTRQQTGMKGIPDKKEGGVFGLWRGVVYFVADANDAVYVATYALLRPALLTNLNIADPLAVFWISVLAGSLGDAVGSFFRVPMEIIYKQVQIGTASGGGEVLSSLSENKGSIRLIVLSWVAGLQIALYDVFKSLLSFLDDWGVDMFVQGAIWGALAGSVASFVTTPFDVLTTTVMTAAQDEGGSVGGLVVEDEIDEKKRNNQFIMADGSVITVAVPNNTMVGSAMSSNSNKNDKDNSLQSNNKNTKLELGSTDSISRNSLVTNQAINIGASNVILSSSSSSSSLTTSSSTSNTAKNIFVSSLSPSSLSSTTNTNTPLTDSSSSSNSNSGIDNVGYTMISSVKNSKLEKIKEILPNTRGVAEAFSEVGPLFSQTLTDIFVTGGGVGGLFNGAVERTLFFGPAAMIFFASYDGIYDIISKLHENKFQQLIEIINKINPFIP